jgi:hypothetical protein
LFGITHGQVIAIDRQKLRHSYVNSPSNTPFTLPSLTTYLPPIFQSNYLLNRKKFAAKNHKNLIILITLAGHLFLAKDVEQHSQGTFIHLPWC